MDRYAMRWLGTVVVAASMTLHLPAYAQEPPIDLGDIAAGGDGSGTADPDIVGINPDSGILESFHQNSAIGIGDGEPLTPVDEATSSFIDSVFIIDVEEMPINTAGVTFDFPPEDVLGRTWDHILDNRIGGEDTPVSIGGMSFDSGVGIHAAAGITFDLDEIRKEYGSDAVMEFRAFGGMGDSPDCVGNPGAVTTYAILSDDTEILDSVSHRTSGGGESLVLSIPPDAIFLTLASGGGDGRFYCNAGTFAEAFIVQGSCPPAGDTHCSGITVEPAGGAPGTYTATAEATDDSGDAILYTFTASNGIDPPLTRGPQAEKSASFFLTVGTWTISATVDDETACPDEAADATCVASKVVVEGGTAGIDLGDITAGGDGSGTASPDVIGINPDSGIFENIHYNDAIGIGDGEPLTPVDDATSTLIDSVFVIDSEAMPINSAGVTFTFPPEDVLGQTWNHILNNRIGGEDTPISLGGLMFDSGVGIHAAAGITYDLDEIREVHGEHAVGEVSSFAGMGDSVDCVGNPGSVTAYLILSDDEEVLDSVSHRTSDGGKLLHFSIPPEATFLTLAAGAGDGRFYCNAGTFAEAVITGGAAPESRFVRGDANSDGSVNLTDGIKVLNFLFLGEAEPECLDAGDFDDVGGDQLSITDAIGIFNWLFLGATDPPPPTPSAAQDYPRKDCGPDPTPDDGIACAQAAAMCTP